MEIKFLKTKMDMKRDTKIRLGLEMDEIKMTFKKAD